MRRNLSITRACFVTPTVFLSLLFNRPLEMNVLLMTQSPPQDKHHLIQSGFFVPIAVEKNIVIKDLLDSVRAGFPLSAVSNHARQELHRSRPVLHN